MPLHPPPPPNLSSHLNTSATHTTSNQCNETGTITTHSRAQQQQQQQQQAKTRPANVAALAGVRSVLGDVTMSSINAQKGNGAARVTQTRKAVAARVFEVAKDPPGTSANSTTEATVARPLVTARRATDSTSARSIVAARPRRAAAAAANSAISAALRATVTNAVKQSAAAPKARRDAAALKRTRASLGASSEAKDKENVPLRRVKRAKPTVSTNMSAIAASKPQAGAARKYNRVASAASHTRASSRVTRIPQLRSEPGTTSNGHSLLLDSDPAYLQQANSDSIDVYDIENAGERTDISRPSNYHQDDDDADSQVTMVEPVGSMLTNVSGRTTQVEKGALSSSSSAATVIDPAAIEEDARKAVPMTKAGTAIDVRPGFLLHNEAVPASHTGKQQHDWDDLDANDQRDPMMVSEYIHDIIAYMRTIEVQTLPSPDYMDKQTELTWSMRGILVNWIIQVHYQLRMFPETLFLTVNIIDRFLSLRYVSVARLQLVGLTALLVASKYEEMASPSIHDLVYLAGNGYTENEILDAEIFMLRVIDFDMSYPSPMTFLRRVSKAENYNIQTRTVAKFLMEISLVDHRFLRFVPSQLAASAILLARRMLSCGQWNANLRYYSGYTEKELEPIVELYVEYLAMPCAHPALQKKYAHRRFLKASMFCREWVGRYYPEIVAKEMVRAQQLQLPSDPPVPLDA